MIRSLSYGVFNPSIEAMRLRSKKYVEDPVHIDPWSWKLEIDRSAPTEAIKECLFKLAVKQEKEGNYSFSEELLNLALKY